ncbi:MAG: SPASM domain-containing protein [Candidatus Aureabacteria bacterium]|nr:SPASM domain-containing protein [Candidatus Auribacterota bacterium]
MRRFGAMMTPYLASAKLENEERLWKEVSAKSLILGCMPPRLTLQTHRRCNFSCIYCSNFVKRYYDHCDPEQGGTMDPALLEKIVAELFPTLQYYEATLLGEPFLSPSLARELQLCRDYGVYYRPTTNGSFLSEETIEKVDGVMDWMKCSFDSHIRGIYNYMKIGTRYDAVLAKLKLFARKRYSMKPVPYFRIGAVLTDLNMDYLPEFIIWCREVLGADDVEVMGFNMGHGTMGHLTIMDDPGRVNRVLERSIQTAVEKRVKLRLAFCRIPGAEECGADQISSSQRAENLRTEQGSLGFIPPEAFERMSYVIGNERNRGDIGDLGYVWSNEMRRHDLCEEFFNRPFIIWNGNVEACGNCDTFLTGNIASQPFREIWNGPLYREIRRRMYEKPVSAWYAPCRHCICMFVRYDRETADLRNRQLLRVIDVKGRSITKGEADALFSPQGRSLSRRVAIRLKSLIPPRIGRMVRG